MKYLNKILYLCFILLILNSCDKTDSEIDKTPRSQEFLIKERETPINNDLQYTDVLSRSKSTYNITQGRAFLGYGYNFGEVPLQAARNFTFPILDVDRIAKDDPSLLSRPIAVKSTNVRMNSFSSFNNYEEVVSGKTQSTKSSGFEINLKVFKIGHKTKKTITQTFGEATTNRQYSVFGNSNISYCDSLFKLNTGVLGVGLSKYLNKTFVRDLYNAPFVDVMDYYGAFMTTEINTGGNLSLLYSGYTLVNKNVSVREEIMGKSMNASFSVKNLTGDSLFQFKFDNNKYQYAMREDSLTGFTVSYQTNGGDVFVPSFSVASTLRGIENIDLGPWFSSIKNNLVISDVGDNSLYPLNKLFFEKNFQERYKRYVTLADDNLSNKHIEIQEPYLYIETHGSIDMHQCQFYLVNKYGDFIALYGTILPGLPVNSDTYKKLYKEYFTDQLVDIFNGLKIVAKHYYYDSYVASGNVSDKPFEKTYLFDIMSKMLDNKTVDDFILATSEDNTGKLYLVSKKNKVGFSIYSINTLELYGFSKETINKLEKKTIPFELLLGYDLYAL